jgi:hypothetical protein
VAELDEHDRPAFVDRQIERFLRWDVASLLAAAEAESPQLDHALPGSGANANDALDGDRVNQPPLTSPLAGMKQLASLAESWIERAEPDQQIRLRCLLDQLQQRLLWRQLRGLMRRVE